MSESTSTFYPPWIGPEKTAVWLLIGLLTALVLGSCMVPLFSCPADAVGCVPEVAANVPSSVGLPLRRTCACNTSTEVRVSTNARTLSNRVFIGLGTDSLDARHQSTFSVVMAQFILHDIFQPRSSGTTASADIPQPDGFFDPTPTTSLFFDVPVTQGVNTCDDVVSDNTPVIDLSNVYGDTPYLRLGQNGLLNTSNSLNADGDLDPKTARPPLADDGTYAIPDWRDASSAGLLAMHVLAMRNHNYWAREVKRMRPTWTDSQLYWKARQLNIAEWQHVVYLEWLPTLLGALAPPGISPALVYDTGVDVRVDTEVAYVILPAIVNTMMPDRFIRLGASSITYQQYARPSMTVLPDVEGVNGILSRLTQTPARLVDVHVANALRNIVNASNLYPVDLVADDIQLARVLKIPDWAAVYTCLGASPIAGDPREAYEGFLSETIYPGTSMGLTAGTVLAAQFDRIRAADPNFYTYTTSKDSIGKIFYPLVERTSMWNMLLRNTRSPTQDTASRNPFVV